MAQQRRFPSSEFVERIGRAFKQMAERIEHPDDGAVNLPSTAL
jgi:hypothetical protein